MSTRNTTALLVHGAFAENLSWNPVLSRASHAISIGAPDQVTATILDAIKATE